MKTTNLTRKEAVIACLDGKKVGHESTRESRYLYDKEGFSLYRENGIRFSSAAFTAKDGYFIYEPEPTFKEVTMYAPVTGGGYTYVNDKIFTSLKDALDYSATTIGYTEVKVFIKEREGEE